MIVLTAASLVTPLECIPDPLLLIEDQAIVEVTSRRSRELPRCRTLDFGDAVLAPGLFDMHIHGSAGHDVMGPGANGLAAIEIFLARHGVTAYLPTTVTAPLDVTLAALERLADAIEPTTNRQGSVPRARPLGIHIEGPFLSQKRRGVHPPNNLLPPTLETFDRLWQAARGHIRAMTISPELQGALEVIAAAAHRGVCVSLGHSDANLEAARAGIAAGARHATHTFNAMRPFGHRDPGIIGEVLTNSQITADIIADGMHVDPAAVKLFLGCKGVERSVLITDATAGAGMPPGHYRMGAFEFDVNNGKCLANGVLAGSLLSLDEAVQNVMQFAGWELRHAVRAASFNPAKAARLTNRGVLQAGAAADVVVLSRAGEVRTTIIGGKVVDRAVSM